MQAISFIEPVHIVYNIASNTFPESRDRWESLFVVTYETTPTFGKRIWEMDSDANSNTIVHPAQY